MIQSKASAIKQRIERAEARLPSMAEESERFDLLQQIIDYYIYTDLKKAKSYLEEQEEIIKINSNRDYFIAFRSNQALMANQQYNYEQSEAHYRLVLELLENTDYVKTTIEIYLDIAAVCQNQNKKTAAEGFLDQAGRLIERHQEDNVLMFYFLTRMGNFYMNSNNIEAIEVLLATEEYFDKIENPSIKCVYFQTMVLVGLGGIYTNQGNFPDAIKAYHQAIEYCEAYGISTRISFNYLYLGNAYFASEDYDMAESCFLNAINILDDISQDSRASAYCNLGKCSIHKRNYILATEYLKHAESIFKEKSTPDYYNLSVIEFSFAEIFALTQKNNKQVKAMKKALQYAELANHNFQISRVSERLAKRFEELEDYKQAYEYQSKQKMAWDAYINELQAAEIDKIRLTNALDKKEREADMERMRGVQLQHRALRAQMNPHFMFNLLNAIQSYVNAGDADVAGNYLAKFANLMRDSLENSDKDVITLEAEIEFLANYLELNQRLRFENRLIFRIEIDDEVETDFFRVPSMIVQPYVENAIEHGLKSIQNGILTVKFSMYDDDNLLCVIEDNGIGRKKAGERKEASQNIKKRQSMGTSITEDRLRYLHESLEQSDIEFVKTIDLFDPETQTPSGTRVEVIIPIMEMKGY
jgi:two-component system, LytTR family, sensor kinase